jgi:hypothetical protein
MWPFHRHEQAGSGDLNDPTDDILSWAERTLGKPGSGLRRLLELVDSPVDLSEDAAAPEDWRSSVQDPWKDGWGLTHTEVAKEPDGEGAPAESSTEVAKEPDGEGAPAESSTEVAEEPQGDGAETEPGTTIVVVTTPSPEASEGEAHIFGDAQEAKLFVERLIDDGFDRERIKTIRGGPAQFNLSFRAVVDFD